ncbi:hypothetical protein I302_107293 [Kwoniella bestiolae CBS 10118]|uniref:Alpha/beta hydrolase fold-3 domain-containing protein n=1 Tax=Kwoniella bestiolae CBS 10118 TaxID=1296100 RepID=A0A1B9FYZ5_9TREE|nr:hypothetical protein I302_06971 [Kwoniella bestiolae CBS 10118]OCF23985.1 hypothetical protein I302_06971 [Kwoniella bestiolae CBS 10118]
MSFSPSTSTYNPPWSLLLQAKALRAAASLGIGMQNYVSSNGLSPSKTEWIDAIFGIKQSSKAIRLDIYNPSSNPTSTDTSEGRSGDHKDEPSLRPGLIIFHGGGFTIGQGTDDCIFAKTSHQYLDNVAIAVSYRLAPENPFPIPVEDCVSSILHIYNNAEAYGIDKNKIIIAGFSAGATLALASQHIFTFLSTQHYTTEYSIPPGMDIPKIRGIILVYPLLDYTIPREEKMKSLSDPSHALSSSLTHLFDYSYLPREFGYDRKDYRISPSIASDHLIQQLPSICMTVCEYDMLRQEAFDFADRLRKMGKDVECNEIGGEKHGWDKPPPVYPKESVQEEYGRIFEVARGWLD